MRSPGRRATCSPAQRQARSWRKPRSWVRRFSTKRGSRRWSRRTLTSEPGPGNELPARTLELCQPIHVRKLRPDGSQAFAWDGIVLRCDESGIVVRAEFNVDLVDLGYTSFRRGDEFVEFYYWKKWFNVFQVSASDG